MEQHTRILKSDSFSRVGLLELEGESCYLKFYRQKSIGQQLLFRMGRARAVQAFDAAEKLAAMGIAVPQPRACVLVPGGVLLLTEGLRGSRDLKALWQAQSFPGNPAALLETTGRTLAALHRAGFAHGDCKWSNLLLSGDRIYLVDLEAVEEVTTGGRKQARDLARFTVNAEDLGIGEGHYDHFMDAYCKELDIPRETVVDRMMPNLRQLRARHRDKYGERGGTLL